MSSNTAAVHHESRTAAEILIDPPSNISQAMLSRYQKLYRMKRERRALRSTLLRLLEADAPIEPGELALDLRRVEARNFSRSRLVAVLGEERVDELLELIEPTVIVYLSVCDAVENRRPDGTPMTFAEIAIATQSD